MTQNIIDFSFVYNRHKTIVDCIKVTEDEEIPKMDKLFLISFGLIVALVVIQGHHQCVCTSDETNATIQSQQPASMQQFIGGRKKRSSGGHSKHPVIVVPLDDDDDDDDRRKKRSPTGLLTGETETLGKITSALGLK